ncbi:hypothetical protein PT015_02585 [Candidatus Mycobacterium wuenschmannii]|uniref:Uncharacterized protein n=1 Tax=Candidatus Mycobacterium wuenschmannii TaxID=3027808 RepID=A0ABY8VYP2_9MYCO|nr:hypothetical protein [Candidatus Mycobacterium wuenschmannii]WIM88411.1 hypothetical protein PT015_02585 [Candidatus Mycobacterium wuenschmannii]
MLSAIAIVPSAPVLVPELAGAAAYEVAELRAAMIAAAATLPPRWIVVGVGAADVTFGSGSVGTFAGFGVDVPVSLSPRATGDPTPMPLCALLAGWLRAQAQPDAHAEVRVCADRHDSRAAVEIGHRLRAEIDAAGEPTGVLIVADGANTLTPPAPGGYQPTDVDVQNALDEALASGDVSALAPLPPQVTGRVAFGVLAGLTEPAPRSAKELYRAAPYGVGYVAGVWQP